MQTKCAIPRGMACAAWIHCQYGNTLKAKRWWRDELTMTTNGKHVGDYDRGVVMNDKHQNGNNFWGMMGMVWWLAAIEEEEEEERRKKEEEEREEQEEREARRQQREETAEEDEDGYR